MHGAPPPPSLLSSSYFDFLADLSTLHSAEPILSPGSLAQTGAPPYHSRHVSASDSTGQAAGAPCPTESRGEPPLWALVQLPESQPAGARELRGGERKEKARPQRLLRAGSNSLPPWRLDRIESSSFLFSRHSTSRNFHQSRQPYHFFFLFFYFLSVGACPIAGVSALPCSTLPTPQVSSLTCHPHPSFCNRGRARICRDPSIVVDSYYWTSLPTYLVEEAWGSVPRATPPAST